MSSVAKSFTAAGVSQTVRVPQGGSLAITVSGTFVGTVQLQKVLPGAAAFDTVAGYTAITAAASPIVANLDAGDYRLACTAFTSGTIVTTIADYPVRSGANLEDQTVNGVLIGAVAAVTGLSATIERLGQVARLKFTLSAVAITHTDAAGSGSSGSLKLFDFVLGMVQVLATKRSIAWAGDTLIDTNVGDMAFKTALGSVAANAGDGALTGTEVDLGPISSTITLASFAATEATLTGAGAAVADGTATATDLHLNESGTAATSDPNGVLTATGTIEVYCLLLGNG